MNCWQQILHDSELSQNEIDEYIISGLPMPVLLQHADYSIVPNGMQAPQCIFRNKLGERFIIAPSYMKDTVVITHATPVRKSIE